MRISDSMPKWVTDEFIAACDTRDHHFCTYCKNKTDANQAIMKRSRNYATNLKNALKRDFFRKSLEENKGNSKGLWNTINQAFGKSKSSSTPINSINGDTDPATMADHMNTYFSTVADKLAAEFPNSEPLRTEKVRHQLKMNFAHTSEKDVEKLI